MSETPTEPDAPEVPNTICISSDENEATLQQKADTICRAFDAFFTGYKSICSITVDDEKAHIHISIPPVKLVHGKEPANFVLKPREVDIGQQVDIDHLMATYSQEMEQLGEKLVIGFSGGSKGTEVDLDETRDEVVRVLSGDAQGQVEEEEV